jgi:outer membrane protein assembly factor BamD
MQHGAYVAAVDRAIDVLTNYPNTPETRDALKIMAKSYDAMDMPKLRDDAQRVLDLNTHGKKFILQKGKKPWWQFWG